MRILYKLIILPVLFLYCLSPAVGNGPNRGFFIENKGQWQKDILFSMDVPGGKLLVKKDRLSYQLMSAASSDHATTGVHAHGMHTGEVSVLDVVFSGASVRPTILAQGVAQTRYNYYISADQGKWAEDCRAFEAVTYHDLYSGVDMILYTKNGFLKYDLIVKKGGDLSQIKFNYIGSKPFLEDGCSFVQVGFNTIMENRPVAYQTDPGGKQLFIDCQYRLSEGQLGFQVGPNYDPDRELVVDPELIFSTFSGSVSDNFGYTACFDDEGSLYSGGIVFGAQFPATTGTPYSGGTDMAILKYDSTGSNLLYATFIGGSSGDSPHSMIVNSTNELIIMGTTGSDDYPTSSEAFDRSYNGGSLFSIFEEYSAGTDIVVTKLDPSGHLVASTYIGSAGNDGILKLSSIGNYINELIYNYGDYQRGDVIVDTADNVYVASSTDGADFPVTSSIGSTYSGGNSDAVVFSLDADLANLRWSSYLGGAGDDAAYSVKLGNQGYILAGGGTSSVDFPATNGALNASYNGGIDGFITIIDPVNDTIARSTFMGTPEYDQVYFIDIDEDQNIYAAGQTAGVYPVTSGVYSNPNSAQFIHKLNETLEETVFSTVIGSGSLMPNISPTAFLASDCENIFLSGWGGNVNSRNSPYSPGTTSGMPVTSDAFDPRTDGSDFYLMALSADGSELLYATFFGSTNNGGDHVDGGTSRFDKRGIVYQSVCTCGGSVDDFPVTAGAWSTVNMGVNASGVERCNNAAFKFDLASLRASFETNSEQGIHPGLSQGCAPLTVVFTNTGVGGVEFFWDFGDGSTSQEPAEVIHTFQNEGIYTVSLRARDKNTCLIEDVFSKEIRVHDDDISISGPTEICEGASVRLSVTGGGSYLWTPPNGLDDPEAASPVASPTISTTYTVEVTTPNGCVKEESVDVVVIPVIVEDFKITPEYQCGGEISYEIENLTDYHGDVLWEFGDGTQSAEVHPVHTYAGAGTFTVTMEIDAPCIVDQSEDIVHEQIFVPNVFTPNNDGKNDQFVIDSPFTVGLIVNDRNGNLVYRSDRYENDWDGDGLPGGVYFYQVRFADYDYCNGWVQILR